jgi:hypothetical protein
MSTPVCLNEKNSLALGHVMTKGRTAGHTHSTDCANPAVLKENHTFKGNRPANDSRVKTISAQMKDHHLCQNFICTVLQVVKEDVLDPVALVTERTLKQRWLVDHRITLSDVSNHAGPCGYGLWVRTVAGTASFFPSFHITGQSTELRNVGLCACCACLDVFSSIASYSGHPARNFVTSTRFLLPCSCNHLLSSHELSPWSRPHNSDWDVDIVESNIVSCLYETCSLEALLN